MDTTSRLFSALLLTAAALLGGQPLNSSAQAPNTGGRNSLGLPVDPALLNNLPELKGVVSWNTLAKVKSTQSGSKVVPQFDPAVRALHEQEVKLQGFMLPIVTGETHQHFLLTMRPPHCPFCLSLGPEYIVEVRTNKPIKHTYEPIVLSGKFAVLNDDPFGLYYRLSNANLTTASTGNARPLAAQQAKAKDGL